MVSGQRLIPKVYRYPDGQLAGQGTGFNLSVCIGTDSQVDSVSSLERKLPKAHESDCWYKQTGET